MNKVILVGRLTRDPEIRYTQGQEAMCIARFTLAVDRNIKREGQVSADFISCVSFGKTAEFAEKWLKKGIKIAIEGRIQTGSYERDGQKVYTTDVVIEHQEFVESKTSGQTNEQADECSTPSSVGDGFINIPEGLDEELPFK